MTTQGGAPDIRGGRDSQAPTLPGSEWAALRSRPEIHRHDGHDTIAPESVIAVFGSPYEAIRCAEANDGSIVLPVCVLADGVIRVGVDLSADVWQPKESWAATMKANHQLASVTLDAFGVIRDAYECLEAGAGPASVGRAHALLRRFAEPAADDQPGEQAPLPEPTSPSLDGPTGAPVAFALIAVAAFIAGLGVGMAF